jgi:hypothetical protein
MNVFQQLASNGKKATQVCSCGFLSDPQRERQCNLPQIHRIAPLPVSEAIQYRTLDRRIL